MDPRVDAHIRRSEKWPEEMTALRPILGGSGLTEEVKWGKPCYSHEGRNIVILQEMKEFLALMFFKGALFNDPEGVLEAGLAVGAAPALVPIEELQNRLDQDPAFRVAFESLTHGRQREYNLYFAGAKQARTREARIERHAQKILDGKGLRDR